MAKITFKSDPDKFKDLTKQEIWEILKRDWPRIVQDMKEGQGVGLSFERPRMYVQNHKD